MPNEAIPTTVKKEKNSSLQGHANQPNFCDKN